MRTRTSPRLQRAITSWRLPDEAGPLIHPRALGSWLVLGVRQLALTLVTLGGVVALGRMLGPGDFALYGYVTVGLTLALAVGDFGISGRIIRDQGDREDVRVLFGVQLAIVLALGAVAAPLLLLGVVGGDHRLQVALLVGAMLLVLLQTLPTARLERLQDFRRVGQIEVGQRVLFTVGAVALVAVGLRETGIPLAALLAGAVAYAAALLATGWRVRPRLAAPRSVLGGFAAHWWHGRVAAQLAYTAYPVLGGLLFGAVEVGQLTLALTVASLATVLAPLVARATFPAMVAAGERGRPEVFAGVFQAFAVASVPVLALVVVCAPAIVEIGFGDEWAGAVDLVRAMSVPALVGLALTPSLPLLYLELEPRTVKRILLGWFAAQWLVCILFAELFGVVGLPLGAALAAGVATLALDRRLDAATGFSLVRDLVPAVVAGVPATAAGLGLAQALGDGPGASLAAGAVCLVVYAIAVGPRRRLLDPRQLARALAEGVRGPGTSNPLVGRSGS